MQPRPVEDNTQLLMWKQKVDLLVAHNKRLREKVQDLAASQKKKNRALSDGDALSSKWSTAFKTQVICNSDKPEVTILDHDNSKTALNSWRYLIRAGQWTRVHFCTTS